MTALPSGWTRSTLGAVAVWGSGGTPTAGRADYYGGDIPWAVIGDLNDGLVVKTARSLTASGLHNSSAKVVPAQTLLVGMYGSIGKLGVAAAPLSTNQAIATARTHPYLLPRFLFYFLLSERRALIRAGKGAAQKNISQAVLRPWPITFPSLDEQRRIVDLLDDYFTRLEAADARLQTAERRLESYRRSSLEDLLGVGTTGTTHLGALVERVEAGRSFGGSAPEATGDEWGVIRVSAMTWGEFRPQNNKAVDASWIDPRHEIHPGDVLVSRANTSEYVGAPVLVRETPPRRLLSDKSLRLIPRQGVDSEWLVMALAATATRRQISALATGTSESMRNISQARLLSVQVPVPPRSGQSSAVAQYAETQRSAQRVQGEIARNLSRSRALRRGLLEAAFAGHLTGKSLDMEIAEELADARGAMA